MQVSLQEGDFGTYLLMCEDGRDELFQVDYDHAGLAEKLGWSPTLCQKEGVEWEVWDKHYHGSDTQEVVMGGSKEECQDWIVDAIDGIERYYIIPNGADPNYCSHDETDGTVDCSCGMTATAFISSAQEWLDEHIGEDFEDPGYFPCLHAHQDVNDRSQFVCLDCNEELGR